MRTKTVIFVAPRLLESSELPQDILFRFDTQASLARELNAGTNISFLFFFTVTPKTLGLNFSHFPHLQIFKSIDFSAFPIFMLFNIVRKTRKIRNSDIMLVTGDISVGLPLTILISRYFLPNSRIQLAIHGDPFSSRNKSLKRHIQIFLFKHFISSVDSFRVVSQHLELFLSQYLGRSKATTVVSPIPIQMTPEIEVARVGHTVGFVGRLHSERGVEEWCSIVQALEKERTTSLVVLGNGPLASYMKSQISEITFFGSLSRQEVLNSYSQISVLLSCAANEGYGLAIREAVLHGTFVVARRNPGTSLLEETFPEAVALYSTKEEAVELLRDAQDKKLSNEQVLTFRKIQKNLDEQSSVKLVNSWIS
jgi:glycosyltransferase involved in cell wall biosynthesis